MTFDNSEAECADFDEAFDDDSGLMLIKTSEMARLRAARKRRRAAEAQPDPDEQRDQEQGDVAPGGDEPETE